MALSIVGGTQHWSNTTGAAATSLSVSVSGVTVGNTLLVAVVHFTNTVTTSTISDDQSNSYGSLLGRYAGSQYSIDFYAANSVAAAPTSITVTVSGSEQFNVHVLELSGGGVLLDGSVQGSSKSGAGTSQPSTPNATTTPAGVAIAVVGYRSSSVTVSSVGTGWTDYGRQADTAAPLASSTDLEARTTAASTSYAGGWTLSSAQSTWDAAIILLKPSITTSTRQIASSAALTGTSSRAVALTARLTATNSRAIANTAALQATNTRSIPVTATLDGGTLRLIANSAALKAVGVTRAVALTAALTSTSTRSIGPYAALIGTTTQQIPVTAALAGTFTRSIGASVSLLSLINRRAISSTALIAFPEPVCLTVSVSAPGAIAPALGTGNVDYVNDDFNDNVLDTHQWTTAGSLGSIVPVVQNQRLELTCIVDPGTNYAVLQSVQTVCLTGAAATVRVVGNTLAGVSTEGALDLQVSGTSNDRLQWHLLPAGTLHAFYEIAGVSTQVYAGTWDATNFAYLRIREAGGTVYWESSHTGLIWVTRASVAVSTLGWSLAALVLEVYAGTYQTETNPGALWLDDLRVTRSNGTLGAAVLTC